jgi:squalene monooxygenase
LLLLLLDCLEGIDAIPVHGYEIFYHRDTVNIAYPETEDGENEKSRPEGRSFHHGKFIQKLRAAATRTPNVTVIESEATELVKNGWTGQILGVKSKTEKRDDYVRNGYQMLTPD